MRTGIVKLIGMMIAGMMGNPGAKTSDGLDIVQLSAHREALILNAYSGPMPRKLPNQRQRRKRARQQPHGRK